MEDKERKFEVGVEYRDDFDIVLFLKLNGVKVREVEFCCFDDLLIDLYNVESKWYEEFEMDGRMDSLVVDIKFEWF